MVQMAQSLSRVNVVAHNGKCVSHLHQNPQSSHLQHATETHSIHVNKLPETRLSYVQ